MISCTHELVLRPGWSYWNWAQWYLVHMSLSYALADHTETDHNCKEGCDHRDASVQEHVGEQGHHGERGFPPPTHCHCCRFSTGWSSLCVIILLCVWGIVYCRLQLDFFRHVTVFPGKLAFHNQETRLCEGAAPNLRKGHTPCIYSGRGIQETTHYIVSCPDPFRKNREGVW